MSVSEKSRHLSMLSDRVPSGPLSLFSDDEHGHLFVQPDAILETPDKQYFKVLEIIHSSKLNIILKVCLVNNPTQQFALKISNAYSSNQLSYEDQILSKLNSLAQKSDNPMPLNVIKRYTSFYFLDHYCIVMELLNLNTFNIIQKRKFHGLPLKFIQKICLNVCQALAAIDQLSLIHFDISPQNILCDNSNPPFFKLIGLDKCSSYNTDASLLNCFYVAPEIILQHYFSNKIHIWSLGCTLAELYIGLPIFPGENCLHTLHLINAAIGPIPDEMISAGEKNTNFVKNGALISYEDYYSITGKPPPQRQSYFRMTRLKDILTAYDEGKRASPNVNAKGLFIDLIMKTLEINPHRRISLHEILQHPFLSEVI